MPTPSSLERAREVAYRYAVTVAGANSWTAGPDVVVRAIAQALDDARAVEVTEAVEKIIVWNDHPSRPEYGRVTLRDPVTAHVMNLGDGLNKTEDKETGLRIVREFLTRALRAALEVKP